MGQELTTIRVRGANGYLFRTGSGFVLIDTGSRGGRRLLEKKLAAAGCAPRELKLIILTHGDPDHAGNAAWLRLKHGAPIAMHGDDAGMVELGDMDWNRRFTPDHMSWRLRIVSALAIPGRFDVFKPDLLVDESFDLSAYGLDARVLHLPGHTQGSIGVLAAGGDLFCGDLLYNFFGRPDGEFIDDLEAFDASIKKIRKAEARMVYPGHGRPFALRRFLDKE